MICWSWCLFLLIQTGAGDTDGTTGANRNPASSRAGRGSSDGSTTSGSEIYRAIRSEFTDLQLSMSRSPAIVVPSPSHQKPLELVGLYTVLCNWATTILLTVWCSLVVYYSNPIKLPLESCLTFILFPCSFTCLIHLMLPVLHLPQIWFWGIYSLKSQWSFFWLVSGWGLVGTLCQYRRQFGLHAQGSPRCKLLPICLLKHGY